MNTRRDFLRTTAAAGLGLAFGLRLKPVPHHIEIGIFKPELRSDFIRYGKIYDLLTAQGPWDISWRVLVSDAKRVEALWQAKKGDLVELPVFHGDTRRVSPFELVRAKVRYAHTCPRCSYCPELAMTIVRDMKLKELEPGDLYEEWLPLPTTHAFCKEHLYLEAYGMSEQRMRKT
jgi:hypothetical protein